MAKDQSDFFKEKKPWSEVKDELLACYLLPYFQKVLTTLKPVRYVDCFAGRGGFDDGKPGSPLIALDVARKSLAQGKTRNSALELAFVEPRWAAELEKAAARHEQLGIPPFVRYSVILGRFERDVPSLVKTMAGQNVFLCVDPYGIRDLDHRLITSFADPNLRLNGIKLLINFNTFGFFRAGCRALKVKYQDDAALVGDEEFTDPIEQAIDDEPRPIALLNAIAGGDYWASVVEGYHHREVDGLGAERQLAELYRRKLSETYRYVLSMPIRLQERQQPKYRMVFATNHPDGCIIMADNMMTRRANLDVHLEGRRQGTLFPQTVDDEIVDPSRVQDQVRAIVDGLTSFVDADEVVADVFARVGVVCTSDVVRQALRQLEVTNQIEVRRDPPTTPTGRPSTVSLPRQHQRIMVGPKAR